MIKVIITYTEILDTNWTAPVTFNCLKASKEDFATFLTCAKLLRENSKWKMVYEPTMKVNLINSSVPKETAEFIKKTFEEKFAKKFEEELVVELNKEDIITEVFTKEEIANIKESYDYTKLAWEISLIEELYLKSNYRLKEHQKEWLAFSVNNKKVYLAYEPWTGKSLTYFSTIAFLHKFKKLKNFLLIAPAAYGASRNIFEEFKNYLNDNQKENFNIVHFNSKDKNLIEDFNNSDKDINILIVSYETFRKDAQYEIWKIKFDFIACDEAKALMSHTSKQTISVKSIVLNQKIPYIQLGEGTPIRNFSDDLWASLDLLQPQKWGWYFSFRNHYCITKLVNYWKQNITVVSWTKNNKELHERLKWVMLTKKLNELADVPDIVYTKMMVNIENKKHLKLLKKIWEEYLDWLISYKTNNGASKRAISGLTEENTKLTQLLRLYQATTIPSIFDKSIKIEDIEQMKVLKEFVKELLEEKKKVVIFTKFKATANAVNQIISSLLKENQEIIQYNELSDNKKMEAIKNFQEDKEFKYPAFVSTIASAWVGITLTSASVCVFMEKEFTNAEMLQAVRRLQRIGQKEKVRVVSIIAKNSVQEIIEKKIESKRIASESVIDWNVWDNVEVVSDNINDIIFEIQDQIHRY